MKEEKSISAYCENAMTALSPVFPVQNLINAVMIGFGIGVNVAIAYFLGAKDTGAAGKWCDPGNEAGNRL